MLFSKTIITLSSLYTLSHAATSCSLADSTPNLPSDQTTLSIPSGQNATFVALGRGYQNYTCAADGSWTSIGAIAQLFDISCLSTDPDFDEIPAQAISVPFDPSPDAACRVLNYARSTIPERHSRRRRQTTSMSTTLLYETLNSFCPSKSSGVASYLGLHSFVADANGALSPMFDFTQSQNSASEYFIGKKVGAVPSPMSGMDVDWLELVSKDPQGSLASTVFRIDTAGGKPPSDSCGTEGTPLSVDYAAMYWFFS